MDYCCHHSSRVLPTQVCRCGLEKKILWMPNNEPNNLVYLNCEQYCSFFSLSQTLKWWLGEWDAATLLFDRNPREKMEVVKVPINKWGNRVQSLFRAAARLDTSEPPVSAKSWNNHICFLDFFYPKRIYISTVARTNQFLKKKNKKKPRRFLSKSNRLHFSLYLAQSI